MKNVLRHGLEKKLPLRPPLDVDTVAQIEVYIVCTERLICI